MGQRRGDRSEEEEAGEGAPEVAAAAGDRDAADDDGGDDLKFEAVAGEGLDLWRLGEVHHRSEAGESPDEDEDQKRDELRTDAGESGGLGVGADGVDEATGGEVAHREGEGDEERDGEGDEDELAGGLAEAEPLDAIGEVYEFALAHEIQALA